MLKTIPSQCRKIWGGGGGGGGRKHNYIFKFGGAVPPPPPGFSAYEAVRLMAMASAPIAILIGSNLVKIISGFHDHDNTHHVIIPQNMLIFVYIKASI